MRLFTPNFLLNLSILPLKLHSLHISLDVCKLLFFFKIFLIYFNLAFHALIFRIFLKEIEIGSFLSFDLYLGLVDLMLNLLFFIFNHFKAFSNSCKSCIKALSMFMTLFYFQYFRFIVIVF